MANDRPLVPNVNCPPDAVASQGYYTDVQSNLNVTRNDKFRLVMDIPNILKPLLRKEARFCHGGNLDRLQLSIWGFVIPEFQINKIEVGYSGQTMKFSGLSRPPLPPQNINYTIDNRFDNYYILYKWLDIQNDDELSQFDGKHLANNSKAKINEYSSTFTVYALDEYENNVAKWDFFNAFPTILGGINANYRDSKEIESNFTFEYSYVKMSLL
jgi:hypothetical protein